MKATEASFSQGLKEDIAEIKGRDTLRFSLRRKAFAFVEPKTQYLSLIYVRQDWRRRKLGEQLLRMVMGRYPNLWAIDGSEAGQSLLRKCGVPTSPRFVADETKQPQLRKEIHMKSETATKIVSEKDGRFSVPPSFEEDRVVFHPIPLSCSEGIVAGETWEGRYGRIYETRRTDRTGKPVFVQYFVPIRKIREVRISLPGYTGRTAAEYAMSQAIAIVRSGRRDLRKLFLDPTVLFEPCERKVTARLMYEYQGAVRVGCSRRLAPEEARAIGCPPEILGKVLQ